MDISHQVKSLKVSDAKQDACVSKSLSITCCEKNKINVFSSSSGQTLKCFDSLVSQTHRKTGPSETTNFVTQEPIGWQNSSTHVQRVENRMQSERKLIKGLSNKIAHQTNNEVLRRSKGSFAAFGPLACRINGKTRFQIVSIKPFPLCGPFMAMLCHACDMKMRLPCVFF